MSHARVNSLAGYGFEVPDTEVARRFYEAFGLEPKAHGEALALGCADVAAPSVLLLQGAPGAAKCLHHLSFFVDAADLPASWWLPLPAEQRVLEVTHAVAVAAGEAPSFAQAWRTGQCVAAAGTLLGWNGGAPFHTPYADCTLVMPSLRQARQGVTIVRLARAAVQHATG